MWLGARILNGNDRMSLRILLAAAGLAMLASMGVIESASAQSSAGSDCSYSECALRVKSGFFGRSLVRGAEEQKVLGLGIWVGRLDAVFEGNPEAIALGTRFRSRHNTGSTVALAGLAVGVSGILFAQEDDTKAGFALGGTLLTLVGAFITGSGEDALHRAIWEYNSTVGR
jgi:hypothetical protein